MTQSIIFLALSFKLEPLFIYFNCFYKLHILIGLSDQPKCRAYIHDVQIIWPVMMHLFMLSVDLEPTVSVQWHFRNVNLIFDHIDNGNIT